MLRWDFAENDRAQTERDTIGKIKVITAAKGHILGAAILGAGAGDQITTWALAIAQRQVHEADNLTDRHAALQAIVNSPAPFKAELLLQMARLWQNEPLLMNKWFALQATAPALEGEPPVLDRVRVLLRHSAYSEKNPNNVSALVLGFCNGNPAEFHRPDGSGYGFWVEQVGRLDRINPIVAARLARCLERWRRYAPERGEQMRAALEEVGRFSQLSRDVREIIDRSLGAVAAA